MLVSPSFFLFFLCPAFCTYSTPSTVTLLPPGQGVAHGCVRIPRGCDCCILYKICLTLQGPASQRCKQDGVNHRYQDNHHWMKYGQKMILITIGTAGKNDNHPPPPEILVTSRCSRDDSCLLLRPEWRLFLSTRTMTNRHYRHNSRLLRLWYPPNGGYPLATTLLYKGCAGGLENER